MQDEQRQSNRNTETVIAVMSQDIDYIKKDLIKVGNIQDEMRLKLDAVLNHYIQREEFESKVKELNNQIDGRIKGVHDRVTEIDNKKLDKEDFEPVKTVITRINWLVITAVIVAIMSLILKMQ